MDVRGPPPTLPKIRTSNYMEGVEDVTSVLTCPLQKPKTEPMCDTWRLAPTRFSNWTRLVQLEARVWQVIYIMCDPKEKVSGLELLQEEIEDAEEEIVSQAQLAAFPEEYMALSKGKEIPKKSSLSKVCPWLDDLGVMRCNG